jgi:hypothetical protein
VQIGKATATTTESLASGSSFVGGCTAGAVPPFAESGVTIAVEIRDDFYG